MMVTDCEWMYSSMTLFHGMEESFQRMVQVRASEYRNQTYRAQAFIAERDQRRRTDPPLIKERIVKLDLERVEKLMQLTQDAGIFGTPLDHWAYVDDGDVETREFLVVRKERRDWGWSGQSQLMGYEGPGGEALNALLRFLQFDPNLYS